MELLNFTVPPFTRTNYAGLAVKEVWEPKIMAARQFYYDMEYLTVVHGLRNCTTDHININKYREATMGLAKRGLLSNPIFPAVPHIGFFTSRITPTDSDNFAYYSVISPNVDILNQFHEAEMAQDFGAVGRLLGYPDCCVEHFLQKWSEKVMDMTWHQANALPESNVVSRDEHTIRFKSDPITNSIYKNPLRIGLTMHMPCSLECERTKGLAQDYIQLAKDLGMQEQLDNILEILDLPVQWDCAKGIGVITTPVFKTTFNSLTTTQKFVVQRESDYYPAEGTSGLVFPWKNKLDRRG